jgi:hypothetical protein
MNKLSQLSFLTAASRLEKRKKLCALSVSAIFLWNPNSANSSIEGFEEVPRP